MVNYTELDIVIDSPKKVVSFKLDVDIISQIDELWPRLGYRSRSQFLREAVLFYVQYVQRRLARQQLEDRGTGQARRDRDMRDDIDIEEDLKELSDELERLAESLVS
jgi:metal-responsive CopG/Arc/MetJ family transcriptional regulator